MISRVEWLQRVVGIKGGRFRQTGISGGNIIVGTVLGIISGKYIFEEPLQHYWAQKRAEEAQAAAGAGTAGGVASTLDTNGQTRKS
ncbi:hypothetical protein ACHAWU_000593 [Discostella pseudostelligera]|uniref:Uncharacterized protein n=1 Tax=Discostella pseudostelligera TaxID=259834 RepID=A0ABD3M7B3_9STRA